jgi:hypothetical protein
MLKLRRIEHVTRLSHADTPVALFETNWYLTLGYRDRVGGLSYRTPTSVVVEALPPIRIHDHVMLARLLAMAASAALLVRAITSRDKG